MYRFNTNDYLLRIPLFIIFFWFGLLKVIELSPARVLIIDTVYWMPFLSPEQWVIVIGYWEMAIGLFFLAKKRRSMRCYSCFYKWGNIHAFGFIALDYISKCKLFLPTLEGQYIIKNIIIIAAALVVGRYYLNQSFSAEF